MGKVIAIVVTVFVGGLLAAAAAYAVVDTQRPDAKEENMSQPQDVQDANGDAAEVVLVYGNR